MEHLKLRPILQFTLKASVLIVMSAALSIGCSGSVKKVSARAKAPQTNRKIQTKSGDRPVRSQRFRVMVTDSALYKGPDFDSEKIVDLSVGTELIFLGKKRGQNGAFSEQPEFLFVRGPNQKRGWVASSEVVPNGLVKSSTGKTSSLNEQPQTTAKPTEQKSEPGPFAEAKEPDPLAFREGVALGAQAQQFRDHFQGAVREDLIYGFQLKTLGTGLEFGLGASYGAPKFLSAEGSRFAQGFQIWTEADLALPIRLRETYVIGALVGPTLGWTQFSTELANGSRYELDAVRMGFLAGGFATACLPFASTKCDSALRLEALWHFERQSYPLLRVFWVSFLR